MSNKTKLTTAFSFSLFLAVWIFITVDFLKWYEESKDLIKTQQEAIKEQEKVINDLNSVIFEKNNQLEKAAGDYESLEQDFQKIQDGNTELKSEIERLKVELNSITTVSAVSTAYTAFCDTGCGGVTRLGAYDVSNTIYYQGKRIIAVDPNVIPLGSLVVVDTGQKKFEAVAMDTGGAIKGNRIDILVKTKNKARNFGVQDVKVHVIDKNYF
jgi:3D (Asp-Asp-Asp) domain-containing protein